MKKEPLLFRGSGVALITPFSADGKIDFDTLGRLIENQIAGGTDALIVCGSTGESAVLSDKEKLSLIEYTVWKANHRIPVIAGTGSNDTAHCVALTKGAQAMGADGVLSVCPYYNKPTDEGLLRHYTEIADCSGLPVILYNVPSRTGKTLSTNVVKRLAAHKNIIGIKQADPSLSAAADLFAACGDEIAIYAGDDAGTVPFLSLGGQGVISVAANLLPHTIHTMCQNWFDGNTAAARETQLRLMPLISALFIQTNPIPVKAAMEEIGYPRQFLRLPLTPANDATRTQLTETLKEWIDSKTGTEKK